jgi:2-polyprenyl-3-methyl-5-hydroxy-6-metoxy-1,4-benzoquinol methylase
MPPDSLKIATEAYYWKPGKALFEAVEVEQYARAGVRFAHPILDLGCGDGTFSAMLRSRGVLDAVDVALDYSWKSLAHAQPHAAWGTIQADTRALPL